MLITFIEQLRLFTENIIFTFGYAGIGVAMLLETLFPPLPSEVIVPFSGFLVADGKLSYALVLLASTLGALLGAVVLYYLGALLGETRTRMLIKKYGKWLLLYEKDFDSSLSFFNRFSGQVVFWARFLPGIRSLISIPAGVAKMHFGKFLLLTTFGTALWNAILLTAGVYLGENWEHILLLVDRYEKVVYLVLFVLFVFWIIRRIIYVHSTKKN